MNDFTKAFRMSCSVFPECNRDFQAPVYTNISKDYTINMAWHSPATTVRAPSIPVAWRR